MNQAQFIKQLEELLAEGDTSAALTQALAWLKKKAKYSQLADFVERTQAKHAQLIAQKRTGLLTAEQADVEENKVIKRLQLVRNELLAGNTQLIEPNDHLMETRRFQMRLVWIGMAILTVLSLGVGGYFFYASSHSRSHANEHANTPPTSSTGSEATIPIKSVECPGFPNQTPLDILVLPYRNVSKDDELSPELTVQNRLSQLLKEHAIPSNISIYQDYYEDGKNQYPSEKAAKALGKMCDAELVIWGTAEKDEDNKAITTLYQYVNAIDTFLFSQILPGGEDFLETQETLSKVARNGQLTKSLENFILILFGVIAHDEGKPIAAVAALEEALASEPDNSLEINMLLADSYLAANDEQKALESYDKVLEAHPDYWLALSNRGMLLYEKGEYLEAVSDLSAVIKKRPDDAAALAVRGAAFMQLETYYRAEKDLSRAKSLQVEGAIESDFTIKNLEENYDRRNNQMQPAGSERMIDTAYYDQAPASDLIDVSKSYLRKGETNAALKAVDAVLEKDKKNADAYAVKVEAQYTEGDKMAAKQTVEKAVKNSVSPKDIITINPKLAPVFNHKRNLIGN